MLLRLRKEGKRWHGIVQLKHPNYSPTTVRYGFLKMMRNNGGKEDAEVKMPPALKTSAVDCVEIARLRKERKTWFEIGERKFPTWSHWTVRERVPRKKCSAMLGKTRKSENRASFHRLLLIV
jgi:hypothetical protein